MKKLAYLALSLSMCVVCAWADNAPPAPTTTAIPPITQSVDQDIYNNAKKFEIDAGYGNTWIPAGVIDNLNLVRLELDYFPMALRYYNLVLGIDGSYNYLGATGAEKDARRLVIFSATPILRYYFGGTGPGTHIYAETGVGPSYLTSKYFGTCGSETCNLGVQFAFQLFAGVGVRFNWDHYAFVAGYRFMHWSNGDISEDNPGIDIPLMFYLGVQI